jgi:two-component system KDP operon response regulator KdpE
MSDEVAQKSVLILDDSEVVLEIARKFLQDAGFFVSTALTLDEVDRHKATREPDIILLDVQMPELAGDDLGRKLRSERGVTAPILLFSTLEDDELRTRAAAAGLDGFVSKNAGLDVLVAEVQALLADQ